MKRSLKATACLCAAIMSLSAMSLVCGADTTEAEKPAVTAETEVKAAKAKTVRLGKVTAVNGSEITVELGELAAKQGDAAEKSGNKDNTGKREKPSAKPERKTSDSTDTATDTAGKKPSVKHGKKGGKTGEFTGSGETLTVTLAANNTLGKKGKTVSASEISVGDILKLEYNDNGELTGVKAMKAKSDKTGKTGSDTDKKEKGTRKSKKTDKDQTVTA